MKEQLKKLVAFVTSALMALALVPGIALAQVVPAGSTEQDGKGSIVISNPTKGQAYAVYKLFDATYKVGAIAYTGTIPEALNSVFEIVPGTTNNVQVKTSAVDANGNFTAAATESVTGYVNKLTTATESATSDGTAPLTFNGLGYGYYAVKSGLGTVVSINSTNPTATVDDKNTPTPIQGADKKVTGVEDANGTSFETTNISTDGHAATAKIGDKVKFQVTFNATNFANDAAKTPIYQYVVSDSASGVDIDWNTLSVSIVKGTGANQYVASGDGSHPVSVSGSTITIPWADQNASTSYYDAPATVTLTYVGTLTSTEGTNKASVAYNTNTGTDTPEDHVYTAQFDLTKVDSANAGTKLGGAEFELYDAETGGNRIYVTQGTDGSYTVTTTANDQKIVSSTDDATKGRFAIKGLKQGVTYYLQETKAPAGYTLPTSRIAISPDASSTVDLTSVKTYTGNVSNTKGSALPTTGGMGTTLFTVVGAALVVAAGVLLVTRRRMQQ